MNKITADHLAPQACVYIRQPTPDQVKLDSQGDIHDKKSGVFRYSCILIDLVHEV